MIARDDLGPEGNTARRLFWEKCAGAAITSIGHEAYETWNDLGKLYNRADFAAQFADSMLTEWDKRWIADNNPASPELNITEDEVLP